MLILVAFLMSGMFPGFTKDVYAEIESNVINREEVEAQDPFAAKIIDQMGVFIIGALNNDYQEVGETEEDWVRWP